MEEENKPKIIPIWELRMSPLQRTLGWCYLPMHALVLPALVLLYSDIGGRVVNTVAVNIAYYALGIVFIAAVFLPYLRREFDVLLDRPLLCLRSMFGAFIIMYALSYAATMIIMLIEPALPNANDEQTMDLLQTNFGVVKGLSIFLAPLVEEVLFRGVLFGTLRTRSRGWAYVISAVVFGLYHVWQGAVLGGDVRLLIYAVQYIPISVALNRSYESSGSLWTSVLFHIGYNALSFSLLQELL